VINEFGQSERHCIERFRGTAHSRIQTLLVHHFYDNSKRLQIRESREHGHPVLNQGVQLRQAGRREAGDGVRKVREREVRLQDPAIPDVRVHDQLHPQAEAPAREVHDEQRLGELYHTAGGSQIQQKL